MDIIKKICLLIVIVGAINWGLIGFFEFNLVEALVGEEGFLRTLIYILVGISGLVSILYLFDTHDHD